MRSAGPLARTGEGRGEYRVSWENLSLRDNLEDLQVDGKISLQEFPWELWTGLIWLTLEKGDGML